MDNKNLKTLLRIGFNAAISPIICLLYIASPLLRVQFIRIRDDRIGGLASSTELFLRRLDLGIIKEKGTFYIGVASTRPCNSQLLKMFKRKMCIINVPQMLAGLFFSPVSLAMKSGFFSFLPIKANEYFEFSYGSPSIDFTPNEENKGRELLKKMGLKENDWFICLLARDSKYLSKRFADINFDYHDYRNWDIATALQAAEYIASKGGFVIRMGAAVEKELKTNNPRIVDYASNFRSDFGDVYLAAKCKFFLGDGCGLHQVAQIFNVPEAWVNVLPLQSPPWSMRGTYIPKKIWSLEYKRFLSFAEIIDKGVSHAVRTEDYHNSHVKWADNSSEEILDLVKEVNERMNGKFRPTKEDNGLQVKFRLLFKPGMHCRGFLSRIGARFLKENEFLLK